MQKSPNVDNPLTMTLFDLHWKSTALGFSGKLKPLLNGLLKIFDKPTDVMYGFQTQDGKTLQAHIEIIWFQFHRKELWLFSHIQLYYEQKPETFREPDILDMSQFALYTIYANSESIDNVFEDDPYCNDDDHQSLMFDIALFKFQTLTITIIVFLDQSLNVKTFITNRNCQTLSH